MFCVCKVHNVANSVRLPYHWNQCAMHVTWSDFPSTSIYFIDWKQRINRRPSLRNGNRDRVQILRLRQSYISWSNMKECRTLIEYHFDKTIYDFNPFFRFLIYASDKMISMHRHLFGWTNSNGMKKKNIRTRSLKCSMVWVRSWWWPNITCEVMSRWGHHL